MTLNVSLHYEWRILTCENFRYDLAEHCALRALDIDPRFKKARYRRGLARRGKLEYARAAAGT